MAKIFGGMTGKAEDALRKRQAETDRKIAEAMGDAPAKTKMITQHEVIKRPKEKKNGGY